METQVSPQHPAFRAVFITRQFLIFIVEIAREDSTTCDAYLLDKERVAYTLPHKTFKKNRKFIMEWMCGGVNGCRYLGEDIQNVDIYNTHKLPPNKPLSPIVL